MSHSLRHQPTSWFALVALLGASACAGGGQASLQSGESENSAALSATATWALSPNMAPSRCLMPLGGSQDNGTPLVLADCDGSAAQAWTRSGDDNSMSLVLFDTKCIDVVDGNTADGTHLQLWDCFAVNDNQKWSYKNGTLQWLKTTKCLDVTDGLASSNTAVMQSWECTVADDHQQWKFVALAKATTAATTTTTTTPATTSDANAATTPAASVTTAPVVVAPPVVYIAVDLTNLAPAGRRGIQTVVNQASPTLCMGIASFPSNLTLTVGTCQSAAEEQFAFDGNGRIGYPSQQTVISGVTYAKGAYCLSVGLPGHSNAGVPVFVPCNSGDTSQYWAQTGNVLVSPVSKTCLSYDPNSRNPNAIVLQSCTTKPQEGWALLQ